MRVLIFLLILANLLFFTWTQGYLGKAASPDALRVEQQLLADQVKIVARDDPPAMVAVPVPAKVEKAENPVQDVCLFLTDLPVAELDRLEGLLAGKFASFKVERHLVPSSSYWVFIPPQPNKQEAERKASALKKLKVPEFFIVQDPGAMRFAISLGIFSSREAAEDRLETLRLKGVRTATIGDRDGKPTHGSLELRGPESARETLRQALAEWLPKHELATCKTPRSVAP